jgi:aldehyde:ferredoxin oxidoreductase
MNYKGGYAGNILYINLTNKEIGRVPTGEYSSLFLGGRGIAAKI